MISQSPSIRCQSMSGEAMSEKKKRPRPSSEKAAACSSALDHHARAAEVAQGTDVIAVRVAQDHLVDIVRRHADRRKLRQQLVLGQHDRRRRKVVVLEQRTGARVIGQPGAVETGVEHDEAPRGVSR